MTQPAKSQEPSMEEILASIRRIIADDDATKSSPPAPEAPAAAASPPPAPARPSPPLPRITPLEPDFARVEAPPAPAAVEPVALPPLQASEIFDLTESMAAPPPSAMSSTAVQFRTIEGGSDLSFDDAAEKVAPPSEPSSVRLATNHSAPRREERAQLLSGDTRAAVDSAFNALAQTVLVQNARTLEDLVREMLRPMLKSWLDDNLPAMVERLVRAEIERVSRGRMG
jgi:hypothetical protein